MTEPTSNQRLSVPMPLADFIDIMRDPVHISDWMRQYIIDALLDLQERRAADVASAGQESDK